MRIFTVKEVTAAIKQVLEMDDLFSGIWLKGEISNFVHHSSGHIYFTLKDSASRLKCVMFRSWNIYLDFQPKDGMQVVVKGDISVYERDGHYQFYVQQMLPAGTGHLHLAYEQLKEKLRLEGLFSSEYKKPLPLYPTKIGIITSPTGAAIRDILTVIGRRFNAVELILFPALVQGDQAPESIVMAIEIADAMSLDVLIIGRGGGSLEELWAFNDERVARAVFACDTPVISAVGHETDFTIIDFVADVRAATPSAAAELVVPDKVELENRLVSSRTRLTLAMRRILDVNRDNCLGLSKDLSLFSPEKKIIQYKQQVDFLQATLERLVRQKTAGSQERLKGLAGRLHSLSPLATLERGYAVCLKLPEKNLVKSYDDVQNGDMVEVILGSGYLTCNISEIKKGKNYEGKVKNRNKN